MSGGILGGRVLAVAALAGVLAGRAAGGTARSPSHGAIYTMTEFEARAVARPEEAGSADESARATALAKADALIRLRHALNRLERRGFHGATPAACYDHAGNPVGDCLDI